jgi:hypothetical protein
MAKKTNRPTQQRSKEDQWRRRAAAQARMSTPTLSGAMADQVIEEDEVEPEGYAQAEMREMPRVATSAAATRAMNTSPAARAAASSSAVNAAAQRRALAASRAARSRMAVNQMSVEEEMHYVRSDVRSLVILTAICLAVIIVLSFIIR